MTTLQELQDRGLRPKQLGATIMYKLALITIAAVLSMVVVGQYTEAAAELSTAKKQYVQTICENAYQKIDGKTENDCGNAQDKTNTEFLCNYQTCWVEEK